MKATIKAMMPGFTGNMDDVVIYYNSRLNCMIARRKVMPKSSPSTAAATTLYAFARRIGLSQAWHDDCRLYISAYNSKYRRHHRAHTSWPSVWFKLMRAQMKARPDLNFETLTREDVISLQLPCRSITASIEAGYLDTVRDWTRFIANI